MKQKQTLQAAEKGKSAAVFCPLKNKGQKMQSNAGKLYQKSVCHLTVRRKEDKIYHV